MPARDNPYVILFNPAPRKGFQAHRRVELPLNVLHPATSLVSAGVRVKLVDQYGDPAWEANFRDALEDKPVCLGVSSMTGPQIRRALEACGRLKARYPDVPTVWGGIHPSILPEQTLQHPLADIVVIGEGEATLPELVNALTNGDSLSSVPGIAYTENGKVRFTGQRPFVDLNAQAPLAYDLVDINHYRRRIFGSDHVSVNTSRGCAFRCGFCYDAVVHRRRWRAMQPEFVVEMLKRVVTDYGIRGFNFTDDNLFTSMDHARRVMEEIVRSGLDIGIGKLHVRVDAILKMDDEFLKLLTRAGVERLTIGVESGCQRILDLMNKDLNVEHVREAAGKLRPYPILPLYLFMMGLPTETPAELAQTIHLAEQLLDDNPRAAKSFNIYTPYPGTRLFDLAVEMGLKPPERLEDWAPFSYRYVPRGSQWMDPGTRKLVAGLDFPLMFLGTNHRFKKTHPIVKGLGKLYLPLAKYRVHNLDVRFPIETHAVRALGLFGRND